MNGWIELGPGPCDGEVLRGRPLANGTLVVVVRQTKGYKPTSVTKPDPRDELVVRSETTVGVFFLPGLKVVVDEAPLSSTESPEASLQAPSPSPGTSSQEPAPVAAGAGATESR